MGCEKQQRLTIQKKHSHCLCLSQAEPPSFPLNAFLYSNLLELLGKRLTDTLVVHLLKCKRSSLLQLQPSHPSDRGQFGNYTLLGSHLPSKDSLRKIFTSEHNLSITQQTVHLLCVIVLFNNTMLFRLSLGLKAMWLFFRSNWWCLVSNRVWSLASQGNVITWPTTKPRLSQVFNRSLFGKYFVLCNIHCFTLYVPSCLSAWIQMVYFVCLDKTLGVLIKHQYLTSWGWEHLHFPSIIILDVHHK